MKTKPFNETIVVKVTKFSGTSDPDKNGLHPVMLQCLAGKMPDRQTLSGTVAERAGFEEGKTYLAQVRERGFHEVHGIDFTWLAIEELHGKEITEAIKDWGDPELVHFGKPEASKEYQRITNAVESQRTKDMKEGVYKPVQPSSVDDHSTAREIEQGTSQENQPDYLTNPGVKHPRFRDKSEEKGDLK